MQLRHSGCASLAQPSPAGSPAQAPVSDGAAKDMQLSWGEGSRSAPGPDDGSHCLPRQGHGGSHGGGRRWGGEAGQG